MGYAGRTTEEMHDRASVWTRDGKVFTRADRNDFWNACQAILFLSQDGLSFADDGDGETGPHVICWGETTIESICGRIAAIA